MGNVAIGVAIGERAGRGRGSGRSGASGRSEDRPRSRQTGNLRAVAVDVCFAGALASVAFAMMDARTSQLVQVAENALRSIEDERAAAGRPTWRLVTVAHQARSSRLMSYRVIIQGMQVVIAVLFVVAAILTLAGV